jgi:hypothetical protein
MTKERSALAGIGLGLLAAVLIPYTMYLFGWTGSLVVAALGATFAFIHGVRSRGTWTSIFRWNAAFVSALPPLIAGISTYVGDPDYPAARPWLVVSAALFVGFIAGSWTSVAHVDATAGSPLNKERVARYFFVFPAVFLAAAVYRALSADMVVLLAGFMCTLYLLFAAYIVYRAIIEERVIDVVFVMFVAVPMILQRYVTSTATWSELAPSLKAWPRALEVAAPGYVFALMVVAILVWFRFSARRQ